MKTRSAKNKGQRLQKYIVERLRKAYGLDLEETSCFEGDIQARIMGASGVDIMLSPYAKTLIPFDIESKNVEKLNLWGSIDQTVANTGKGRIPLLVIKKNHRKPYIVLELEDFIQCLKKD